MMRRILSGLFLLGTLSTAAGAESKLSISPPGNQVKLLGRGTRLICSIDDYGFTGLDAPVIQWISPDGVPITETQGRIYIEKYEPLSLRLYITNIQTDDAGLYTCQTELDGEALFADTLLTLYAAIKFEETETEIQATAGDSVLLPCVASGQPEPEVSWRHNREKITDSPKYQHELGRGLRINNVDDADNGTFECRAEVESQGNLKVRIITLDVQFAPVITLAPISHTIIQGDSVTLSCQAKANPLHTYAWFREQKVSEMIKMKVRLQSESDTFTVRNMTALDVGRYFCKASNSLGYDEEYADLDMMIPPVVKKLPHKVVLEGRTVIIPCDASGDPRPVITWSYNGSDYTEGIQQDDKRISIDSTQPGVSKLIIHDIQRSYTHSYTCTASSEAGTHSQIAQLTVEYTPTVYNGSATLKLGWPGQTRNFTCVGHGLPPPSMNWFRGGQYISNSDDYTIHTDRSNTVTSTLQIKISEANRGLVFGSYSCIAKNQYGYVTETVTLQEVTAPHAPRNVSVVSESPTNIVFKAAAPKEDGGKAITEWRLEYSKDEKYNGGGGGGGGGGGKMMMVLDNVNKVKVKKLEPGTIYNFFLSAGNVVGFGKAVKFRGKTPSREQVPADVPVKKDDPKHPDANATYVEATKGKKQPPTGEQIEAVEEDKGLSMIIIGGLSGLLVLIVIVIIIIVVVRRRNRGRIPDHKFYNGGGGGTMTSMGNGDMVCVQGKEVDNIQLQIHRSPLPEVPHKSPEAARKHHVKMAAAAAAQSPMLDPRKVAWDQMLIRQAMEDEQEGQEITDTAADQQEMMQRMMPPPPPEPEQAQDELPPPPAFLLQNDDDGGNPLNRGDNGSYHAVLDGYHSEDNVDDIDVDEPFRIQMPNMYGQVS